MVNASLNWASIVGIVNGLLALVFLYLGSQKHEFARKYDAILSLPLFAAGGILFFQGWRLDPVLQFSMFLTTLVTIFLGYQNLKLRKAVSSYKNNKITKSSHDWKDEASNRTYSNKQSTNGPKNCSYCGAPVL